MSNNTNPAVGSETTPYLTVEWKNEIETLKVLRSVKPNLHRNTLYRMRRAKQIEWCKLANRFYYKPQSAFRPNPVCQ